MKGWHDLRCPACGAIGYGPEGTKCSLGHRARKMTVVTRPERSLLGNEGYVSPRARSWGQRKRKRLWPGGGAA